MTGSARLRAFAVHLGVHAQIQLPQTYRQDFAVKLQSERSTMPDNGGRQRGVSRSRSRSNSRLVALPELAVMRAKQSILGLVYTGGEVCRPPLIGMQLFHASAMPAPALVAP